MPIDAYLEAKKRARRYADTIRAHHYRAFTQALDVLVGPDNLVDADLLGPRAAQFVDSLDSYYTGNAAQMLQAQTQDPLLRALAGYGVFGLDRAALQDMVQNDGAALLRDNRFINGTRRFGRDAERILTQTVLSQITGADIDDIIAYTGVGPIIDRSTVDVVGATKILDAFDQYHGDVPRTMINDYLQPQYKVI